MSKFIGRAVGVGIAPEAVRGTGVAPTNLLGDVNYTLEDKANKAESGEALGTIAGIGSQAIVTGRFSEGNIECEIDAKSLPIILKSVFGSLSSAAEGADYKHTIGWLESNQHPTFSITLDDPNGDLIFEGCMVDTFEFNVTQDEIVKAQVGIKAFPSRDSDFSHTAILDASYKFVGRDMTFKVADDKTDLTAATGLCIKDFSMTVNKNVDYDDCLGTLEPEDILNKQVVIEGSITLNYEDRTIRNYMLNGTTKAIRIDLVNTRETLAGGANNPAFRIDLAKCHFKEWESTRGNDDIVGQTVNFTALYDVDNDEVVADCYVINDTASY